MIPHLSERAIILAPHGRDATIAAAILDEAGLRTSICGSLPALVAELAKGAGFALLTEEGMRSDNLQPLAHWLGTQPEWSDFPFVLLTRKGGGIERNPAAKRFLDTLGNVTFLERPFHPTTLISLARSALRGRRRQYDARARLRDLHRGADKYRSLFESIDAGFCIIDVLFDDDDAAIDYAFVEANPAFERQTGLVDAVGHSARTLVPGLEDHWFEIYGRVARTGESIRFEEHSEALGDIWYEVYAFKVGDTDRHRVAVLFNDISERRRMEQALRSSEEGLRTLNETLEQRVAERSRALETAQEALRQSQKLEAMGQLTGGVAHDFNNLLTPIVGSLDLLQRRGFGSERDRRLIEGAAQSAERARTLVQRLLAFARRQPLQATAVDIGALVTDLADLITSTCGPRIRVNLDLATDLPSAKADANQIEMALLNLTVNARDAMPDGGALTIGVRGQDIAAGDITGLPPGAYVDLSVEDTGTGMSAATITQAIEPFFTTKGIGRGTGLGLSMVHGLAAQLGGALRIDSALGQGTTMHLWLPVTAAKPQMPEIDPPEIHTVARGTAVVVDDEELVRQSTAHMMGELGYRVIEAQSGEEALHLFAGPEAIDVLVTDHLMPGMTGVELAATIRRKSPETRVLIVSGYAESKGITASLPRLAKPFRQSDLARTLAQL